MPFRFERSQRWKSALALALLIVTSTAVNLLLISADFDRHRPLQARTNVPTGLIAIATLLATVLWAGFCMVRAYRGKKELNTSVLHAAVPFTALLLVLGIGAWANIAMDSAGVRHQLHVGDIFTVERGTTFEKYIGLNVPSELGGDKLWFVQDWVDLNQYPIGKPINVVCHAGYLGMPWCEYEDPVFADPSTELNYVTRAGTARSAMGSFSSSSPYRAAIQSWSIPVDVRSRP